MEQYCFLCQKQCSKEDITYSTETRQILWRFLKVIWSLSSSPAGGNLSGEEDIVTLLGGGSKVVDKAVMSCEECWRRMFALCEAFHRMKAAELEIHWRLRQLREGVRKVGETESSGWQQSGGREVTEATRLRGAVHKNLSSARVTSRSPRVELTRCDEHIVKLEYRQSKRSKLMHQAECSDATIDFPNSPENDDFDILAGWEFQDPEVGETQASETHQCEICGKFMSSASNLRLHNYIHDEVKPYQCAFCPHQSSHKDNLAQHEFKHHKLQFLREFKTASTSDEDFVSVIHKVFDQTFRVPERECVVCHRKFALLRSLEQHLLNKHSQKVNEEFYRCQMELPLTEQGKESGNQETRAKFRCPICSRILASKMSLGNHIKTHGGTKKFDCAYCSMKFRRSDNASQHTFRHHRTVILNEYQKPGGSEEEFSAVIDTALTSLIDREGQKGCVLCGKRFCMTADTAKHIIQHHRERLGVELERLQGLPDLSSTATEGVEAVSNLVFDMDEVKAEIPPNDS